MDVLWWLDICCGDCAGQPRQGELHVLQELPGQGGPICGLPPGVHSDLQARSHSLPLILRYSVSGSQSSWRWNSWNLTDPFTVRTLYTSSRAFLWLAKHGPGLPCFWTLLHGLCIAVSCYHILCMVSCLLHLLSLVWGAVPDRLRCAQAH